MLPSRSTNDNQTAVILKFLNQIEVSYEFYTEPTTSQ
jgi:hypothetical protein